MFAGAGEVSIHDLDAPHRDRSRQDLSGTRDESRGFQGEQKFCGGCNDHLVG